MHTRLKEKFRRMRVDVIRKQNEIPDAIVQRQIYKRKTSNKTSAVESPSKVPKAIIRSPKKVGKAGQNQHISLLYNDCFVLKKD